MVYKIFLRSIITYLVLIISSPLENKAEHKNSLIKGFCIASMKSKLKSEDKKLSDEISYFTCGCFMERYRSGSSIKNSRDYCKDIATEKYNL
tara:strand:+ start:261 stop:536 length:276 start_codon:yes stop_codon:yes gene_type:complete